MGFTVSDKALSGQLNRHLGKATREHADSLAKLSSGQVFTSLDPRPSERSVAEGLEFRLRSLAASKRNINDAVSLLQTADSSMSEINNMIIRMKELNIAAASTTVSDQERRYLLLEYQALHDEVNRIALTTNYNGIPILNGESENAPEELIFRIDDPHIVEGGSYSSDSDVNAIHFRGLKSVVATTLGLGLNTAIELLADSSEEEGISVYDVEELMVPEDSDIYATVYDQAVTTLSTQRAVFGAMQARLQRSMDFMDIYQENIAAAKSRIADTDYATEVANLAKSKIMMHASTALLAASNINTQLSFELLSNVLR